MWRRCPSPLPQYLTFPNPLRSQLSHSQRMRDGRKRKIQIRLCHQHFVSFTIWAHFSVGIVRKTHEIAGNSRKQFCKNRLKPSREDTPTSSSSLPSSRMVWRPRARLPLTDMTNFADGLLAQRLGREEAQYLHLAKTRKIEKAAVHSSWSPCSKT